MTDITIIGAHGAKLCATDVGRGPPVLLLHGAGQTRGAWRRTSELLAERGYRAITVDLRGHGHSDWSQHGYGFDLFVEDLRQTIELVGGRPALVGASMGGLVSLMALGGANPPPASALVLVDITTKIDPAGASAIQAFMNANPDGFASVDDAANAVALYLPGRPRPNNVSGLRRNLRERDGRLFWHWDPAFMSRADPGSDTREQWQDKFDIAAAGVSVPTLLIRGEKSEIVSSEGVQRLQELIPLAEVVEVAGAGHMVAGDANTPFAEALIAFLMRVYGTGDSLQTR